MKDADKVLEPEGGATARPEAEGPVPVDDRDQKGSDAAATGEAAEASQPDVRQEIESLRAEVASWKEKAEFNWDQFLRTRADLDNYRKRVERDLAFRIRVGKRDLILGFVEVLDNLERVLEAAKELPGGASPGVKGETQKTAGEEQDLAGEVSPRTAVITAGVEMIKKQMEDILRKEGVLPVDCLGKPFDPALEEAVEVVDGGGEPGTVVEVLVKGYTYEGDLLRAARVKVAR
jgi:molecular chaperone GrpE